MKNLNLRTVRLSVALALLAWSLPATIRNVAAPTGNAGTDVANINSAISASVSGDTVHFATGTYNTAGTTITLNSDHRTYDCTTAGTCIISNPNSTNFNVTSTRNTMTVTKLVMVGCGIELSNGNALFVNVTITLNAFRTCQTTVGTFINEGFGLSGGNISNNTFTDGGSCYANDGTCDGQFAGIHMMLMPNTTIDSNVFTHVDRGIASYYNSGDTTAQPGIRVTNNTFTRLHTRALEFQSLNITGAVYSGNYAHQWQNPFYGSWCISIANGFGGPTGLPPATTMQNSFIQNNVCDARDNVLNDLVTLHTDTTLCLETSGVNTTVSNNNCLSLTTAAPGTEEFRTGWDQGVLSGQYHGTLSNNCFGGAFISNGANGSVEGIRNNWYTFGDNLTPTDSSYIPTISGTLSPADATNCPNVLASSLLITTSSYPAGVTGNSYFYTSTASGGSSPYTWSITAGSLPTGLSLAASTGVISGTPTGSGLSSFTIRVTDNSAAFVSLPASITINSTAGVISDNFTGTSLNGSLWTFVNPVGDGTQSVSGGQLHLTAPAAALHDPGFNNANNSVRVTQPISGNFTAIAKFDSIPSQQYQFEGILANQDGTHWMYLSAGSTGDHFEIDMNTQLAGVNANIGAATITPGTSIWLSLSQNGTAWTAKYSTDGVNFTTLVAFTQAFTTVDTGPYAGNYNASTPASPAFTALVDSFLNGTSAPDMSITMTHSGSFSQSQVGATYTLTATNSGGSTTTAPVSMATSLPAGLVATAISGSGWTCTLNSVSCTRSDTLAASASYPTVTLTVSVSANATTPLVPTSAISGGGETNAANNNVSDSTVITPVVVSHSIVFTGSGVSAGGFPIMTITDTADNVLGTYTLTASSASYTYSTATLPTTNIRVQYTNGAAGRTASITNFTVDGNAILPTGTGVFTLSHSPSCPTGFLRNPIIGCAGYMEFPVANAVNAIDTTAPSSPTGLTAVSIFSGAITLGWNPSIDDVGVTSYQIVRNGISIGVTTVTSFIDTSVVVGVTYTYGVLALDAAANASTFSTTASVSATQSGTVYNGGITIKGIVDFSSSSATIPFSVVSNEPAGGASGQAIWNSQKLYPEIFLGPSNSFAVIPLVPSSAAWTASSTSLGGGGSSPVVLCAANKCPSGTYEIQYRIWTTAAQGSSTSVLSFAYNDGTAARVQSSASLDNSALNFVSGSIPVVTDGVNPVTYYTLLTGTGAYSGRITITRKQ